MLPAILLAVALHSLPALSAHPAPPVSGSGLPVAQQSDYPIQPVPFNQVKIQGGFWGPRLQTNRDVTLWANLDKCEETGRLANFAVAGGRIEGEFEGIYFNDSDVFKVIEGASYTLAQGYDAKVDLKLDQIIADIALAQEDDGYLYTARTCLDSLEASGDASGEASYDFPGKEERWSHLAHGHELYNVGHLYEAAVAHFQATGKRTLLDVALKNADLIVRTFGSGEGQRYDTPGHEEIEIGLVKLYRLTGEQKYLEQAEFFLESRGQKDKREQLYGKYVQDHLPVLQQTEAVGHAVRAGYLYSGMADVAALTGNQEYVKVLDALWQDVVSSKMYLTGGIGSSRSGEAFGEAYDLPNLTAYNETCAAIANAMWNHRMFLLHGDAKYLDVLERILYNGFLSGISLEGDKFFYPNPLESDGKYAFNQGSTERKGWFNCSCCPVNIVRFMPSLAGMIYATKDDTCFVNLYVNGSADVEVGGQTVSLTQTTEYPWNGEIAVEVNPRHEAEFEMRFRIPGWAVNQPVPSDLYEFENEFRPFYKIYVNGVEQGVALDRGFASVRRKWNPGDLVKVELRMPVRRVLCSPLVDANFNMVAMQRGPIVYCLEGVDNGNLQDFAVPAYTWGSCIMRPNSLGDKWEPNLLEGIVQVSGELVRLPAPNAPMPPSYFGAPFPYPLQAMMAIPYFAWGHRGPNPMKVWVPGKLKYVSELAIERSFTASTSHCYPNDSLDAISDGRRQRKSNDHSIPRLTWWDHKGTTEWVEYAFKMDRTVSSTAVYWFDDTGRGSCRVPEKWNLFYRKDGQWIPVQTDGPKTASKDEFNRLEFAKVVTDAVRLEVELQEGFSGGILEWRVGSKPVTSAVLAELASAKVEKEISRQAVGNWPAKNGRPNIVVIYADDHSEAAISSYGSKINQTPNIDKLAAQGMRFTQSFVANSICGPARATLLTGTHSHTNGRVNNVSAFNTKLPTWAREMRREGYRTAMIGKWHLPGNPLAEDFDFWAKTHGYYAKGLQTSEGKMDRDGYTVDLITDLGLEWIEKEEEEKPFVLWLSHNAVHRTWMPGPKQLELYRGQKIPEPKTLFDDYSGRSPGAALAQMRISQDLFPAYDLKLPITGDQILDNAAKGRLQPMSPEVRKAWDAAYGPENEAFAAAKLSGDELTSWNYQRYIQDYLRCVSALDDSVGRVMQYLDDNDLADNTIVIYTSDQGFYLGEHGWYDKRWMYEPSLRTPMIIHWPGVTEPGSTSDLMVQNIDMAPTLLEMAGQEVPATMQGASLLPLLSNSLEELWRTAIYYHYQEYNEGRTSHRVAEHYGIRTERYKLMYIYRHDAWEFYDLQTDPDEMNNLINDPVQADEIKYMKQRLKDLREQFGDTMGTEFVIE
jgi:uncharacterized protein